MLDDLIVSLRLDETEFLRAIGRLKISANHVLAAKHRSIVYEKQRGPRRS